jgi:hypothetical protein
LQAADGVAMEMCGRYYPINAFMGPEAICKAIDTVLRLPALVSLAMIRPVEAVTDASVLAIPAACPSLDGISAGLYGVRCLS